MEMGEGLVQIQPRDSYSLVEANLRCLRKLQLTESKSKSLSAVTMDATNFYTQFDSVMGENILNLVMGAPSESMLKMAASKFQQATIARMVCIPFDSVTGYALCISATPDVGCKMPSVSVCIALEFP